MAPLRISGYAKNIVDKIHGAGDLKIECYLEHLNPNFLNAMFPDT